MTKQRAGTVTLVMSMFMIAACGPTSQPPAPATTSISSPGSGPTNPYATLAPRVVNPVNATAYLDDSCRSLTAAQRTHFDVTVAERTTLFQSDGESCRFRKSDKSSMWVVFANKHTIGLSYEYAEHDRGAWPFWEPTSSSGFPAVAFNNGPDDNSCTFAIGLTDTLFFWVAAEGKAGAQRCAAAKEVAEAVLQTVVAGA